MRQQIIHTTTQEILFPHAIIPKSYFRRLIGLMGQEALERGSALMITGCGAIHTHFMKFTIDIIFVDKDLRIRSIYKNVRPWRFVFAGPPSYSVIEFTSGYFDYEKINIGDQLYVGS